MIDRRTLVVRLRPGQRLVVLAESVAPKRKHRHHHCRRR